MIKSLLVNIDLEAEVTMEIEVVIKETITDLVVARMKAATENIEITEISIREKNTIATLVVMNSNNKTKMKTIEIKIKVKINNNSNQRDKSNKMMNLKSPRKNHKQNLQLQQSKKTPRKKQLQNLCFQICSLP